MIKISIITATFNSQNTIIDCINSVSKQDYKNIEHILVDGNSSDNTRKLLLERIENIDFLISEPDLGIYDAFNKGLKLATGDIVGFLNSDDCYASDNVLNIIASEFESDPNLCALYGDLVYVKYDNINTIARYWKSSDYPGTLKYGWMPPHPTLYVRHCFYNKIDGFDSNFKISADYLSILKLFKIQNFKSKYIPKVMVKMRLGGVSNRSFSSILNKTLEDFLVLKKFNSSLFRILIILFFKNIKIFRQLIIK